MLSSVYVLRGRVHKDCNSDVNSVQHLSDERSSESRYFTG